MLSIREVVVRALGRESCDRLIEKSFLSERRLQSVDVSSIDKFAYFKSVSFHGIKGMMTNVTGDIIITIVHKDEELIAGMNIEEIIDKMNEGL